MNEVLANVLAKDPYDELPEGVKMNYNRNQWLWLSDGEKATLIQRETEPEYDG